MSKPKKKIGLIATEIEFTFFSIKYKVKYDDGRKTFQKDKIGPVSCSEDIGNKDLNLKPTILSENMEVIFMSIYMTPHFYQGLLDRTRKDFSELRDELNNIYKVGDVVGYILI